MKRILVVNPNASISVTRAIDQSLAAIRAMADVAIDCVDIPASPKGIETEADIALAGVKFADVVRDSAADGFVSACFSDPGLYLAREATDRPVVGIAESAYRYAATIGEKFGIVSILDQAIPRHKRALRQYGLSDWLANDRAINVHVADLEGEAVVDKIASVGAALRDLDGARSIILGCAGMARYRAEIEQRLGIPVIDPTQAAIVRLIGMFMLSHTRTA